MESPTGEDTDTQDGKISEERKIQVVVTEISHWNSPGIQARTCCTNRTSGLYLKQQLTKISMCSLGTNFQAVTA